MSVDVSPNTLNLLHYIRIASLSESAAIYNTLYLNPARKIHYICDMRRGTLGGMRHVRGITQ